MSSRKLTVTEAPKDEFKEDDKFMYFTYFLADHSFTLIYNKEKESCLLLRNGKPAILEELNEDEEFHRAEVTHFLTRYHHNIEVEYYH